MIDSSDRVLPKGRVYSADQTRTLDRIAIEQAGIPGFDLMSRAGRSAFRALRAHWPESRSVKVLCGGGNNGGDGYIVAGLARQQGMAVQCVAVVPVERLQGDARLAFQWATERGVTVSPWSDAVLEDADGDAVIVDAMLGTGISGEVRSPFREIIEALRHRTPILAIDIPTGLCADTGAVLGGCVHASVTVTFIGRKLGLYTGIGPEVAGRVIFAGLNVPDWVYQDVPYSGCLVTPDIVSDSLPRRTRCAHKGIFGRTVVIGGEQGMAGALLLACGGAIRTGAGLVYGMTRPAHCLPLTGCRPEVMFRGADNPADLIQVCREASAIVAGPGLGQGEWAQQVMEMLLAERDTFLPECRLVLDADALNLLAKRDTVRFWPGREVVMTPHPGEAARLLGCSTKEISQDRVGAARAISRKYGAVAVLKGAGTIVADARAEASDEPVRVNTTGNPGMASAGMGDVLSGMVGGLLSQGMRAEQAAICGVALHGLSADLCVRSAGMASLVASDVIEGLKEVFYLAEAGQLDWSIDDQYNS